MPKIVFLNRYFPPDSSATGLLLADLASYLSTRGRTVHVIAGTGAGDGGAAAVAPAAGDGGASLHRIATVRDPAADRNESFHAAAGTILQRLLSSGDIVVAMTDPPLLCLLAAQVAHRSRARLVNWHQDIYPEAVLAAGVEVVGAQAMGRLRDGALKAAAANVAISERIAATLVVHGAAPETLRVIANWTNDTAVRALPADSESLRRDWGLEHKFVVAYCGTLGRSHEIETVLAAATALRDRSDIRFLCVGGGHYRAALEQQVAARSLANFVFQPYQAEAVFAQAVSLADVHWVSLPPEMEGLIFPSKLYGIAAAGRPIVAVTAFDGEIAHLVRQHQCGLVVPARDGDAFARSIAALAADRDACEEMGRRARAMLDGHFSRTAALRKWDELLDRVSA
jgi:glycosyltransferase involved in cell wall biosynthesis